MGKSILLRLADMADMQVVQTWCSMSVASGCQAIKLEKHTTSASRSSSRVILCCIPQICFQIFFNSEDFCCRSGLPEQNYQLSFSLLDHLNIPKSNLKISSLSLLVFSVMVCTQVHMGWLSILIPKVYCFRSVGTLSAIPVLMALTPCFTIPAKRLSTATLVWAQTRIGWGIWK